MGDTLFARCISEVAIGCDREAGTLSDEKTALYLSGVLEFDTTWLDRHREPARNR
jgi:hypothetical protein